ncbi:hypothetical protein GBAR_LOCUS12454 [Geodia barretti]|uniref:NELL2-like EGF domain-containing protein n=1 Tax=Geodia barretti TaxID=519541 RepID=A0AA35WKX9_GEOBA|nr:hypothetical protein GBAR_LOCUS12454 [Geodia barretti]
MSVSDGTHECHQNADCTNVIGSYSCTCQTVKTSTLEMAECVGILMSAKTLHWCVTIWQTVQILLAHLNALAFTALQALACLIIAWVSHRSWIY